MVICFEVGKTYRYKGKVGDPTPFTTIGINEHDARLMVSGDPLVCTYVGEGPWRPMVGFRGMSHEDDGWAFTGLYDLFEEVEETTAAKENKKEKKKEEKKEEKKEMTKFEVGKKYHYTGSLSDAFDFVRIWIDVENAEYIASGKPLTVEWYEPPRRIKFKEFDYPWTFTDAMLNKFVEVPPYGESVESSEASYIARQTEWATRNNVRVGTKVRLTRTAEDHEGGWGNIWESNMDKNVGRTGTVREIEPSLGLYIDFGTGEDRAKYRYPFFVLEVVEETPAPTDEVDWEEKYTALKDKATEMLRILGDVAGDFKEEIESL